VHPELTTYLDTVVKEKMKSLLAKLPLQQLASLDWAQEIARFLALEMSRCLFDAWKELLVQACQALRPCPACGRPRSCKWRDPITVDVLGIQVQLPKLYLECHHCAAPGVSVMKLLTGLTSGDASIQLQLAAAYCASQHSYQNASKELQVHYGQEVERTKVRRMALAVEQEAMAFAEATRRQALERVSGEAKVLGSPMLLLEADGGKVRTGKLEACEPGDPGYGKTTAMRGAAVRKRPTTYRELITFDVRAPGEVEASALDVLVPLEAAPGERSRRMLALASRKGLGDNTKVFGLGDMGSGLAAAFEEAFVGYDNFWSADWKHTRDYVQDAGKVLRGIDVELWAAQMRQAIWDRDEQAKDELLRTAATQRMRRLPAELDKCPVKALTTYLKNNWRHMEFARQLKDGLPIVSARAESQVRDRTKKRFSVAGAWLLENIEPKAVLRSIIAEGRWEEFWTQQIMQSKTRAERGLVERLQQAVAEGRLSQEALTHLVQGTHTTERAA
jgi:hypothetical protein